MGKPLRRALSANVHAGFTNSYDYDFKVRTWNAGAGPNWRINSRLNLQFYTFIWQELNQPGYVNDDEDTGVITFGRRDQQTLENTLTASYMFSNTASLNFRMRHYWSKAEYDGFFTLMEDGRLKPSMYDENHDVNYNAFNIDMTFRWIFAPGSEMVVNWKNAIVEEGDQIVAGFWDNMRRTLRLPKINSFSVKILYYLDYLSVFR